MKVRRQGGTSTRTFSSTSIVAPNSGFDFTLHMRHLCTDMVTRLPDLHHIDLDRVAISFSQARRRVMHGLQATLTPMRFEGGAHTGLRRGRKYTVQKLIGPGGREMLYILSFYLPRFMDTDFREKLITIFHELWHISPQFDGDLRRHEGRCYAHSNSQKDYDLEMGRLADRWLALSPPVETYAFLHDSFDTLRRQHGGVFGIKIQQPKLIPVGGNDAR